MTIHHMINTLRPKRNGQHFADNIFKCIFFNENAWIFIKISLKFIPKGPINNIPALIQPLSKSDSDDIFKYIFFNENVWILIKISLKFIPKGPINNIPTLIQTMAWRRPGDKPLSEPMMIMLLTHICITLPQRVNIEIFMGRYVHDLGSRSWGGKKNGHKVRWQMHPVVMKLSVSWSICENSFDIKKTPYHTVYYITLSVTMTEYRWEYELAKDTSYFCSHVNYGVSLVSILLKNNRVISRFDSIDGSAQDSSNSIANMLELPQYCAKPFVWCNNILIQFSPGPWFNIKMTSYQYRKSHCGDKTILRPSYLHNGISYIRVLVPDCAQCRECLPPLHAASWCCELTLLTLLSLLCPFSHCAV